MRPAGEIRIALLKALKEGGRATSRQLAQQACVGASVATKTLDNLVRAEAVVKRDPIRVPGVNRPVPTYELCDPAVWKQQPVQLAEVWQ